jgi:hypothetical protein
MNDKNSYKTKNIHLMAVPETGKLTCSRWISKWGRRKIKAWEHAMIPPSQV